MNKVQPTAVVLDMVTEFDAVGRLNEVVDQ